MIRRIAITGPESTGKSMLAMQLADHYKTVWVVEYAREYIDQLGRPYEEGDIVAIARGQLQRELEAEMIAENAMIGERSRGKSSKKIVDEYLFSDTEALVTKIWSDVKFGRCDPWILDQVETHAYDLYLLCYIDLPWEYDPQREHPEMREHLFNLYHEELLERNRNFRVVSGIGEDRLRNAIKFVDKCFF